MANVNIFEKATRRKIRFATVQGNLSVEDLWDLPLPALNELAKDLNRERKIEAEEDFLVEKSRKNTMLDLCFDLVIHILDTLKQEKEDRAQAAENQAEKAKLVSALARKQDQELDDMSKKDIEKAIKTLDK